MKDSAWRKRLLQSTRGKILGFLRSGERTVNDLAADLELTDNAVRAHLASLERDGLIHQVGTQAGFRKPHALYALTPDAEQFFPKSYGPLLSLVLDVIRKKLSVRDFRSAMRSVGKTVAGEHLDGLAGKARDERIEVALQILSDLGGAAKFEKSDGKHLIRGRGCPIAAAT